MFIIISHIIKMSYLRPISKGLSNENQYIEIDGIRSVRTDIRLPPWRKPLFPHALPCNIAQIRGFELCACGGTDGNDRPKRQQLGQTLRVGRCPRLAYPSGTRTQTDNRLFGRGISPQGYRSRQTKREDGQRSLATSNRQRSKRIDVPAFFIRIGARYRRIRKRPRGVPSPQFYEYKTEKLQELETLYAKGDINLFYGDESHVCTEGYVPYGWQFHGEDVFIPSERAKRLNIFGMIDRNNRFEGFCTTDSIDAEKVVDFLDRFSFQVEKKTFVVLDNASVHRNKKIRKMRPVWEKRGLFLFYIPPYSPHLNIVETLWRIMKGKWLRPQDYVSAETLFYSTNRILAAIGGDLRINYKHSAA